MKLNLQPARCWLIKLSWGSTTVRTQETSTTVSSGVQDIIYQILLSVQCLLVCMFVYLSRDHQGPNQRLREEAHFWLVYAGKHVIRMFQRPNYLYS